MSVGSIVGGGVRLLREQPRIVAIWGAVYLVVAIISTMVMQPWTAAMVELQQQGMQPGAAKPPPGAFGAIFLLYLGFVVLAVVAFAAVVRAVVQPAGDRFAYLRLGMDELRLIGLGLVLMIGALLLEIVAIIAIALASAVVGAMAGEMAAFVTIGLLSIVLLCGAIYVQLRLSLSGALTVMRGRIAIRDSWRMTRGHCWTLAGVFVTLGLLFLLAAIVAIAMTSPDLLVAYARLDAQAVTAVAQQQIARQAAGLSAGMIVTMALSAAVTTILGVITCGAVATAALELGGAEPGEADAGHDPGLA